LNENCFSHTLSHIYVNKLAARFAKIWRQA
jgi:hypothetical protein